MGRFSFQTKFYFTNCRNTLVISARSSGQFCPGLWMRSNINFEQNPVFSRPSFRLLSVNFLLVCVCVCVFHPLSPAVIEVYRVFLRVLASGKLCLFACLCLVPQRSVMFDFAPSVFSRASFLIIFKIVLFNYYRE